MLVILPLLAFSGLWLAFASRGACCRQAFLYAAILWGVGLTAATELLSLPGWLNRPSLALFWGAAAIGAFSLMRRGTPTLPPLASVSRYAPALAALALVLGCTLLVAVVSPPNNWDSMTYHMGRVVHWIQNRSVAHYPTNIIRQLCFPPWAEFAITHLQILSGGDRLANLVQWFSMVGSVLGVTLIARELRASGPVQAFAAVIAATIPMGMLQASSTQNDYVASFWIVCFAYFGMLLVRELQFRYALATAGALGLALLTKGTVYFFVLPFILWFLAAGIKAHGVRMLKPLLAVVALTLALNAGHYLRNYLLFGTPIASTDENLFNEHPGVRSTLSNLARNIANNTWTPGVAPNLLQYRVIQGLHGMLGTEASDPDTSFNHEEFRPRTISYHEDFTGNGLHMLLILATVPALFWYRRRSGSGTGCRYFGAVMAGFLLFCVLLKWQPWGVRLLLPFFVLGSPMVAVMLPERRWLAGCIMAVLVACSLPWLFENQSRPLVGEWTILNVDRSRLYFASNPAVERYYLSAADAVAAKRDCRQVGLSGPADAYEYPLWMLLAARMPELPRIEHVNVDNISRAIPLRDFDPCTVVRIVQP